MPFPITDLSGYNARMSKGLGEKLFFLDHLDLSGADLIDFGCADGALLEAIHTRCPDVNLVGYDTNVEELSLARLRLSVKAQLFSEWEDVESYLRRSRARPTVLLLSSVIHEVYSYASGNSVARFWSRVHSGFFDHIVIRDMATPPSARDIPFDRQLLFPRKELLRDFENIWGEIDNVKDATHFLLKYRYADNWAREVQENYLPLNTQEIQDLIPYKPIFDRRYVHRYTDQCVRQDFGISLPSPTHFQFIV